MVRRALAVLVLALASRADAAVFSCDESGLQAAIAAGGGPHTFSCAGPTTVTLPSELTLSANLILDGEDRLTLSGGGTTRIFSVPAGRTLELRNLVLREGYGSYYGGCIQVATGATLVVATSTITDCHTQIPGESQGGAIYSTGDVTVTDSTISHNSSGVSGGGIASGDLYTQSAGASLSVSNSRFDSNEAIGGLGGAIASVGGSLSLVGGKVTRNSAASGGGVYAKGASTLTDVTVSRNDALNGGGLVADGPSPILVTGSTFWGNSSNRVGIYIGGAIANLAQPLTIRNSTITQNHGGGAITNGKTLVVEHTTISKNTWETADTPPATAVYILNGNISQTFRNTLIDGTCSTPPYSASGYISQGGNIESPGNTCQLTDATDQVGVPQTALGIGKFGPHGGPTGTIPLRPPSVAIDAAADCPTLTDQRGVARPQGLACDVGAFEYEGPEVVAVPALPPAGVAALLAALLVSGARARRRYRVRASALSALAFVALHAPTARAAVFPCSEAGILAAAAAGGGPHTFSCAGPTTVTLSNIAMLKPPLTLDGEGRLTVSGGNSHGVFFVSDVAGQTVELRNLTLTAGTGYEFAGDTYGGCIVTDAAMVLRNVAIVGCQATIGGGFLGSKDLTLIGGRVVDNHALQSAGGIGRTDAGATVITDSVISGNTAGLDGGGIAVGSSPLSIADSTVSGNTARSGGGVFVGDDFASGSSAILRTTISGNTATDASQGGGGIRIAIDQLEIADSTIADNKNGGISIDPPQYFQDHVIRNTTLAGNTGPMPTAIFYCFYWSFILPITVVSNTILSGSCSAGVRSGGGNIESPGDTCGLVPPSDHSNVSGAALHLGKLGLHGGPTRTIPLHAPSVAIDAAPGCLTATDQRGVARPQASSCDVGAYEWDGDAPVPALPRIGVVALIVALAVAGAWALRARRAA